MKQEMLGLTSQRETFRINCVVSVGSTKLNIIGYQLSMQPSCNVVQYKFVRLYFTDQFCTVHVYVNV